MWHNLQRDDVGKWPRSKPVDSVGCRIFWGNLDRFSIDFPMKFSVFSIFSCNFPVKTHLTQRCYMTEIWFDKWLAWFTKTLRCPHGVSSHVTYQSSTEQQMAAVPAMSPRCGVDFSYTAPESEGARNAGLPNKYWMVWMLNRHEREISHQGKFDPCLFRSPQSESSGSSVKLFFISRNLCWFVSLTIFVKWLADCALRNS